MGRFLSEEFRGMVFFVSESIQAFIIYTFGIAAVWLWTPFNPIIKAATTGFIILNFYNILRHFIYVRWAIWKETLKQPKKNKWEETIKSIDSEEEHRQKSR